MDSSFDFERAISAFRDDAAKVEVFKRQLNRRRRSGINNPELSVQTNYCPVSMSQKDDVFIILIRTERNTEGH